MPVDVRRKGEDGFFGSLAIWAALFACKAPYHQDRVRKNADALLEETECTPLGPVMNFSIEIRLVSMVYNSFFIFIRSQSV